MNDNLKALLTNQYKMLDELLGNINKNIFVTKPENGKWSVFENIAHLGRYNEVFLGRMQESRIAHDWRDIDCNCGSLRRS